ncbi:DUF1190 domain-containing protein [Rhodanobacter sp. PCA2]|uniref:DUF1190 domain-containing protein n=1 Tax=Rhodanobacter sp. PCA2 TaxID=2006117 RepID=UPI0015E76319|nr:DUF1190 domain-containing protein [Rhodanobacter sp. PCA2]MBA2079504.1 hypothetical protein [Rhodanobacter sp. PCA2]
MKRSRTAALLLMGTAPILLTACNSDREASRQGLYTSVEACVAATNDSATCKQAFAKAQQDAVATAPRYTSRAECEAKYGAQQCVERNDNAQHSFFGPMMTGFFLSQMMRNGAAMNGFNSAPAFRDNRGDWQRPATGAGAGTGGVYRGGAGTAMVPVSATPDRAVTVSRGGFGESSGSRGAGS